MKKFSIILLSFMLVITATLFGCGENTKDEFVTLKVSEVTHSIFYAPLYVAINNGYFEQDGIKIELSNVQDYFVNNIKSKFVCFVKELNVF